MTENRVSMG